MASQGASSASSSPGFEPETCKMAMEGGSECTVKVTLSISAAYAEVEGHAVHSQVMKIRQEDQHLGEDFREGLSPKDRIEILQITSQMKDVFFSCSRPAFPSPLGMKAGVRSA